MTDAQRAREGWERSAEGWIGHQGRGDVNRTVLLDPVMLRLAGNVADRRVLDIGSGEGRFCRMLAERGAHTVGLEPTPKLITEARDRQVEGHFVRGQGEEIPFRDSVFDLAISYIVLVDIAGYAESIMETARVLKPGGRFLVANLQSFATTRPTAWYRTEEGEKLHVAVVDYFEERAMLLQWGDMEIVNWHRPFQSYMQAFLAAGLVLSAYEEPRPTWQDVERHPTMLDEYRVPLFHVMLWEKPT